MDIREKGRSKDKVGEGRQPKDGYLGGVVVR